MKVIFKNLQHTFMKNYSINIFYSVPMSKPHLYCSITKNLKVILGLKMITDGLGLVFNIKVILKRTLPNVA